MKNWIFLKIIILILIVGCSSNKNLPNKTIDRKLPKYSCLDSLTASNQMKFYELRIPNTWCTYIGSHDMLSHSPKSLINSKDALHKNYLIVSSPDTESYKSEDIEITLSKNVVNFNVSSKFNPTYTSATHDIYGKYYIIKNTIKEQGAKILNLEVLFNHKNRDYIIDYYADEDSFEKNINEVMDIISSFTIKE